MLIENGFNSKRSKRQQIHIEPKFLENSGEKKYSIKFETALRQANRFIKQSRKLYYQLTPQAQKAFVRKCNPLIKLFNNCKRQLANPFGGRITTIEENLQAVAAQSQSLHQRYKLHRDWQTKDSVFIESQTKTTIAAHDNDTAIFARQSKIRQVLGVATAATFILTACAPEGQTKEPIPVIIEDPTLEQDNQTETVEDIINSPDVPLLTSEATETPQEPLEIELTGTDQLDQETIDTLEEQTSEFVEAATDSINNDPALKAALYSEGGLKVAFDPSRLIYHDGMWGYFAPEGGPLSNNLLIISNAEGSQGEIRFCSIEGAGTVLGLNLNEQDYFLDFAMIEGNSVCMVRSQDSQQIQAITDTAGQWTLPENSGYGELNLATTALANGTSALDLAKNGNGEEATTTPEATPTPEATATPENTPTAQVPEWPSDLEVNPRWQHTAGELPFTPWAENYITYDFQVIIRNQDLHLEEPFTMLNGRYYVQAWADSWVQEPDGTQHHFAVPVTVWDTENYTLWSMATPFLVDYSEKPINTQELMTKVFTGPIFDGSTAQWWIEKLCLTDKGERVCEEEGLNLDPFWISIGWIPTEQIAGRIYKEAFETQLNFWRDLIEDVYTKESVETFYQTLDSNLLKLNQNDLPEDFIIPIRAN